MAYSPYYNGSKLDKKIYNLNIIPCRRIFWLWSGSRLGLLGSDLFCYLKKKIFYFDSLFRARFDTG